MKYFRFIWLLILAVMVSTPATAGPQLVFDARNGTVFYAQDALAPWFPASLTKLMTAYVTFGAIRSGQLAMGDKIITSEVAFNQPPSKIGFPVGAPVTVERALELLIVKSANDVAVMLAEAVAGSVDNFADKMNQTAHALGMNGSHFVNPHGLPDPRQITTARDLALLAQAIIREFPEFDYLFSLDRVKVGKRTLRSHNRLLGKYEGADGMKTGYICASGYNVVARATRGNKRVVAVVLGARSGKARNETAVALLDQGFAERSWGLIAKQKLEGLSAEVAYDPRPKHMGPEICARSYRNHKDPYAFEAWKKDQRDEKVRAMLAGAAGGAKNPLIDAGGGESAAPAKAEATVPIPTLRPKR